MPLTRLDNLITSKTGKYLYVSPDDFNASDELNNRGNSPVRPFKSIQRAFLEVARYSFLPGVDNDRFDQFTIMLMPGEHFIDNRPGLSDTSNIDVFGYNTTTSEWTDNSILDLSNPDNIFYKFNNTEGGCIIPRGTSLVGYDLRRTMVKPLYVPDPADSRENRSAIFNVTGGCYFWQFTIKDGETTSLSPLYNSSAAIPSGEVYYSKDDFTKKTAPNYSHHKLTVFEYADKEELSLLYRKIAKAFEDFTPGINIENPSGKREFDVRVQENRIVGPLSDSRAIESLQFDDATSDPAIPGSNVRVTVTTKIEHGYFAGQSVAILNTDVDDKLEGTFVISSIDANDGRKFTYFVEGEVVTTIGPGSNSGASSIAPGDVLNISSIPALGTGALTLAEVDSVESASPYVFNVSIRSTWGICGIWANGLKATGFKSMVIAQYTGVSLQKDDRAFIRYDEFTNTFNQASLKDAFDSIPYQTKGDSFWKDEWRNFHVRASEDAFIQNVSIFAVGFADHFLMESGGDMSITNSNSNFGNTSLHAIGHKGFAFNSDKGGYIDAIIPPKVIEPTEKRINYYPFNLPATINGVEGIQTKNQGVVVYNNTRLYLESDEDAINPDKRPAVSIEGYRLGARQNDKIYVKLEKGYATDDQEYSAELNPTGFVKYIAKPDIISPSTGGVIDNLSLDAANLIEANRTFFQEEVFGYVLEKYPDLQQISYVNPGLDPQSNRYQDSRNLIIANRDEIVDEAYDSMFAAFGPAGENNAAFNSGNDETKCKRDIGLIVDAIAEDLRDGGNGNIIDATKKYFNADGTPLVNGLLGEEEFAIFAFRRARDLCKQAIANLLTVTDTTVSIDPANTVAKDFQPTGATYDPSNGNFVFTLADHGFNVGDCLELNPSGFTFTCAMDGNKTEHSLPQIGQFAYNKTIPIDAITDDTIRVNVGASGPNVEFTPSGATYNPATGDLVLEIGTHTLSVGEGVVIDDNSLSFTCAMDGNQSTKTYPRPGIDPFAGRSMPITAETATSITVNAGVSGPNVAFTPTNSTYSGTELTLTVGQHGLGVGRGVVLADDSITLNIDGTPRTFPNASADPAIQGDSLSITSVGASQHTATNAVYDAASGVVTLTIPTHGFTNGDYIKVADSSLTFTCALDNNTVQKAYPRAGYDYPSGRWLAVSNVTTNTFDINVGSSSYTGAHTFVSATTNGIDRQTGTLTVDIGNIGTTVSFVSATTNAVIHQPQSAHTFTGATANAVKHLPQSAHTFVRATSDAVTVYARTNILSTASRNKDARNLILANKNDIIDAAIAAINAFNPTFVFPGGSDVKCKRDLGIILDGIAQDLWFGGNEYSIGNVIEYFDGNSLLSNGVAGELNETLIAIEKIHDQINLAVNNQLASTDTTITLDGCGDPTIVDDSHCDAEKLIRKNKKFIAKEAYQRMLSAYPSYTPSTGNTEQDCLDDVNNVMDEILYNLKFGGNHKTFDAAKIYTTGIYEGKNPQTFTPTGAQYNPSTGVVVLTIPDHGMLQGQYVKLERESLTFTCAQDSNLTEHSYPRVGDGNYLEWEQIDNTTDDTITINVGVSSNTTAHTFVGAFNDAVVYGTTQQTFLNSERDEAERVFAEALSVSTDVMRNIAVTPTNWTPAGDTLQITDGTIIPDVTNPTCQGVASSLSTLFGVITQAIGNDAGVGTLTATRTVPTQPTSYAVHNCSDVLGNVDNLISIFTDNLFAGNLNSLPDIDNGLWDCANVRSTIDTLTSILIDALEATNLDSLPDVVTGGFALDRLGSKCYRDIGIITDAVINDLRFGGNLNSIQAGEAYFIGNNLAYIDKEKTETLDAWGAIKNLAISSLRNHTTQINSCLLTNGSAIVNVGSNTGLAIGMKVTEYLSTDFSSDAQLNSGATPITANIDGETYVKRLVGGDRVELGVKNARLTTGATKVVTGPGGSNLTLYFEMTQGYWADTLPVTDPTISTSNAGYPECANTASAVATLVDNIISIINNGIGAVDLVEQIATSSDFAKRATIWTIDTTGTSSPNPHLLETGTAIRLIPRPRWDDEASKYVDVDKRLVRLPNGFETNRTYFVIAPGRITSPYDYSPTGFAKTESTKLLLAETKANAAAGIYIYSSESDTIDKDVEIDLYQFTLDEKYDLTTYKCNLDVAVAGGSAVTGGIVANVAHIFDAPQNVPQRVFFRPIGNSNLPLLAAALQSDNAAANFNDSTAGVADSQGRLNPEFEFFVRYQTSLTKPNKVFTIYKTFADAINDQNRITFQTLDPSLKFTVFANKSKSPYGFDPRSTSYSNSTTGRWYIKVKDTSSSANAIAIQQESILWRTQQSDYTQSPDPKTADSWYFRQEDSRGADDRTYKLRYVIPSYLEGVRDPINGFVIKTRTDTNRRLRPQNILLKPAPGNFKSDAFFQNDANPGERIGWTSDQIIAAKGSLQDTYDPYNLEQGKRTIVTDNNISMTIQSGRFKTVNGEQLLELSVYDYEPNQNILSLNKARFRTVKITAPQGGSFEVEKTLDGGNINSPNRVTWTGNTSGSAYIHAYTNVGNDHYLILKGFSDGDLEYSPFYNTRFQQGSIYADMLDDPDMGKSLPLKRLIAKEESDLFYKQNGAPVYTITPGDTIKEDGTENRYVVASVEDQGDIDDTFYIFEIETLQRRIAKQQDGIYYLTAIRGNISPLPLGAGNQRNFRNFKFSQPISYLYPQNYKNDPFWFQYAGTTANEKSAAAALIDPPATYSAADNYIHGLVRTNDSKSSMTKETIIDLIATPAFENNTYTTKVGDIDSRIQAQEGNASSGAEDRKIPISGDNRVFTDQKWYVELRRPSIARAGNHTFEYLGFGPGNYSTGLPARQEIVLTATQDYYAQAKRQDAGIVFYTGINSNGELYIGNRKINAITGEEEFLERAALLDSDDDDDDISSLVTTFDVPVTFNKNITINGGDGELVSNFNSPVAINVNNDDLIFQPNALQVYSNVNVNDPDLQGQPNGPANNPLLDRTSFTPRQSGDIFIGKNQVKAAQFVINPIRNGQGYKIQTHTIIDGGIVFPSNVSPNQSALYSLSTGGTSLNAKQYVKYGTSGAFILPTDGDILFKGGSVERSGSLGWVYSNFYTSIQNAAIASVQFNGTKYVKLNWDLVSSVQQTNNSLGIVETSRIRIKNFYPNAALESDGGFPIVSPTIQGTTYPFNASNTFCYIEIGESIAAVSYDNDGDGAIDNPVSNPTWDNLILRAGTPINGGTPAPTMEFSSANWKETGVIGADVLRTDTASIGDYKLGINTIAAAAHSAYETAFVDANTDPKANLEVIGTTWISGKKVLTWLDESSATLTNKTETGQANAFMVGGFRDNPDSTALIRANTLTNRVGINIANNNTLLDKTFVVNGEVRIAQTLTLTNGTIESPSGTFNLGPTSTSINLFPLATTLNVANDATATQTINIGNATANQTLTIGGGADTSALYIHSSSESSVIDIGTVSNSNSGYQSSITMGGAFQNSASLFNIRNRLLKIDGDIQLGTPSTGITKMYSFTPKLEIFSASGGSNEIDAFRTGSILSIGADAGTTTINNSLYVKASERVDGNITLNGGLSVGIITATRGIFSTSTSSHAVGATDDLNIDIYRRTEIGKTIDSQGNALWGGTTFQEGTNTYYLPLNEAIGITDIAIGDFLLIDRGDTTGGSNQANSEIVKVVTLINASNANDSEGYRVEVERAQEGTTLRTDHPDNCKVVKLLKQNNVSYLTQAIATAGSQGDSVSITTAEFGGSIKINDIIRLNDGELFNVSGISTDASNIQGLRINDGAEPTAFTVFEVLSTTGQTTIEGPTEVRNDITLTGSTSNNDKMFTITNGASSPITVFDVDSSDGDTRILGDLSVGANFQEFTVDGDLGNVTMKGGNLDIFNNAGTTKQLEFINGNGNLTIAGVIETEGTGTNLFAGDIQLNGGDLTVNDGSTTRFKVNNDGGIDLGGITDYISQTGGRKWVYQSTVSGDGGVLTANVNYFTKASSDLVLKLPPSAKTGDMIRFVDIGGALTYNVRMIIRAPDGIPVAGDSTNTNLSIGSVDFNNFGGGELIVTTPNASFGLVYSGATNADGSATGVPSNLRGWWLMEI